MAATKLQDELLLELGDEKRMIDAQIGLFAPLAASLRRPAARRLAGKGLILFGQLLCWLLVLAAILMIIFLDRLYPFYLLSQLSRPEHAERLGAQNVRLLQIGVYALIGLAGLLFFLLARALGRVRQKNDILNVAGSRIRTLMTQLQARQAAIAAFEERHAAELPAELPQRSDVNTILNPGYEAEARMPHKRY